MKCRRVDVDRRWIQPGEPLALDVGGHERQIPAGRRGIGLRLARTGFATRGEEPSQPHRLDVVEVARAVDAGRDQDGVHETGVRGGVVRSDAGSDGKRPIRAPLAKRLDLGDLRRASRRDARGSDRVHVPRCDPCCRFEVLRPDLPLLLERGAAEVEPAPAARAARLGNRVGLVLGARTLVDASVVGPVRIDGAAGTFEVAQHRERARPRHREEIDAKPERREPTARLSNERQQPLELEVVIDEEHPVRALARRNLRVAKDLFAVTRVDDGQYRGAHRLESLPKLESVHGEPPAGAVADSSGFIIAVAAEPVVERGRDERIASETIHGAMQRLASVVLHVSGVRTPVTQRPKNSNPGVRTLPDRPIMPTSTVTNAQ